MTTMPTPCHIIHLDRLKENLDRIRLLKEKAHCQVLLAVKGFSAPYLFEPMRDVLDGASASGLYAARLGREHFGGYIQTYSPAFLPEQMEQVLNYSDAIVLNSERQLRQYAPRARQKGRSCGIRVKPDFSRVWKEDTDPCRPDSWLGLPIQELSDELLELVDGIHIHVMCEQQADALEELTDYLIRHLDGALRRIKWLNLGGGQLLGHPDYEIDRAAACLRRLRDQYGIQIILEPCEGILTRCGSFAARVLDIVKSDMETAILDASPVCHMQDAIFRGWQRDILGESAGPEGYSYRLSGPTCFAGDTFGVYTFDHPLEIGEVLHFQDTAAYTWVKNNAFNSVPFPTICTYSEKDGLNIVKTHDYETFLNLQ